ncbi:protein root hair defective 3 [Tanacetum coccineum]|uniref:Protein root hair defective 3 n=1 Tax=Tanacetum coccineum TaxID=301880 RepID=A0ABQ4XVR2_9ASTR
MERVCPCGNGHLIRKVTRKGGSNFGRAYYKCPGSYKGANIVDCKFYSFEDELKECPCGRGLCRTAFGANIVDCKFYSFEDELKECPCGRGLCRTAFVYGKKYWICCVTGRGACRMNSMIESSWQACSFIPPQSLSSSSSQSSSQGARMQNAMLLDALEVTQSFNALSSSFLFVI